MAPHTTPPGVIAQPDGSHPVWRNGHLTAGPRPIFHVADPDFAVDVTGATESTDALNDFFAAAAAEGAVALLDNARVLAAGPLFATGAVAIGPNGHLDGAAMGSSVKLLTIGGGSEGTHVPLKAGTTAVGGQWYVEVDRGSSAQFTDGMDLKVGSLRQLDLGVDANASIDQPIGEDSRCVVPAGLLATAIPTGALSTITLKQPADARWNGWPPSGEIVIGSEEFSYSAVTTSSSQVLFTITARAINGTSQAAHNINDSVAMRDGIVCLVKPLDGPDYVAGGVDQAFVASMTMVARPSLTLAGKITGPGPGNVAIGVCFQRCRDFAFLAADGYIQGFDSKAIEYSDSKAGQVWSPIIYGGSSRTNNHYGHSFVYACNDITVFGGIVHEVRHAITTGGNTALSGVTRGLRVVGMKAVRTKASSFDTHAGCLGAAFEACHAYAPRESGFNIRGPRVAIIGGLVRRAGSYVAWLRNQTNVPTSYAVDGLVGDGCARGVRYSNDLGYATTLVDPIAAADTPPFTRAVVSVFGFKATNGNIILGDGDDAEHAFYDTRDATANTLHITSRALDGTIAADHAGATSTAEGETVLQGYTGTGSAISSVSLRGIQIDRCGSTSLAVYSSDVFPLSRLDIDDVTITDQQAGSIGVDLRNLQDVDLGRIRIYGAPATQKAIQLKDSQRVDLTRPAARFTALSTGVAINLVNSDDCRIDSPISPNAGTGVLLDTNSTGNTVRGSEGLAGCTTKVTLGAGAGNIWNPITFHASAHKFDTGYDPLRPSDLGEFFDTFRVGEVETLPWTVAAGTVGTLVSGEVVGCLAVAKAAGTFTQVRCMPGTAFANLSFARLAVWDSSGAVLAETADIASTLNGASTTAVFLATLGTSVTVAVGAKIYIGYGFVWPGAVTGALRGYAGVGAILGLTPTPRKTRVNTGYTGGSILTLPNTATGKVPWMGLVA